MSCTYGALAVMVVLRRLPYQIHLLLLDLMRTLLSIKLVSVLSSGRLFWDFVIIHLYSNEIRDDLAIIMTLGIVMAIY